MRRRFRVVGSSNPSDVFNDLDALRCEQSNPAVRRRPRLKETFTLIPHDCAQALARRRIGGPAWVILIELDRLILKERGRNPVQLTNHRLKDAGIIGNVKTRAAASARGRGSDLDRVEGRQWTFAADPTSLASAAGLRLVAFASYHLSRLRDPILAQTSQGCRVNATMVPESILYSLLSLFIALCPWFSVNKNGGVVDEGVRIGNVSKGAQYRRCCSC